MGEMPVLGEDQKAALVAQLRAGAPKSVHYEAPDIDFTGGFKQGQEISKGLDKLSEAGDGSIWEGVKNKLGMGEPNIYADNYQAEFGQYDPAFNANPTGASTAPVGQTPPQTGVQTGGMYGGALSDPYAVAGVNLDGSRYRGAVR
jgi:hypothetical protein